MTKQAPKAVLLENIHQNAVAELEAAGFVVTLYKESMSPDRVVEAAADADVLGIRSNTKISAETLAKLPNLSAIGTFCIGTNQVDLAAASERGVVVFNAPFSNTRSVVELTLCEIIALGRRLPEKSRQMHEGEWNKSATGSHEVRGRKLGIVGYGNIGSQLSVVAEALGLDVYYYDVADKLALGNATKCDTLNELLKTVDIVTLHVDGKPSNKGLFGKAQFAKMRPGALFLNLCRGLVVDTQALAEAIKSGHIAGAAVDVFEEEPKGNGQAFSNPLQGLPNVILTPHVGGSTEEAQANIGSFVARKLARYYRLGHTSLSVNLPGLSAPRHASAKCRIIYIHQNVPGVMAKINTILGDAGINIESQYLDVGSKLGYLITDTGTKPAAKVFDALRALPETVRLRVINGGEE